MGAQCSHVVLDHHLTSFARVVLTCAHAIGKQSSAACVQEHLGTKPSCKLQAFCTSQLQQPYKVSVRTARTAKVDRAAPPHDGQEED